MKPSPFTAGPGRIRMLFFLLLVMVLIDRSNGFLQFSVVYSDSDQKVLWQAALDMARGICHAPCFYGQSYNPLIEPLLAVPFLQAGIPVWQALPLVTTLLGLAPFLLLSGYLYRSKGPAAGMFPLILALLLPPEYTMLTALPRGFVTGIFFGILGLSFTIFHTRPAMRFSGGLASGLGLFANLNSILLFPLILPFLKRPDRKAILPVIAWTSGLLAGLSTFAINAAFYRHHPGMVVHPAPETGLGTGYFMMVLSQLDNYFDFITPVLWRFGYVGLLSLPASAFFLHRRGRTLQAASAVVSFAAILLSFCVSKTTDGTNSVFFSGSRMFLAYPFILLFLFLFITETLDDRMKKRVTVILFCLVAVVFPIKLIAFGHFIRNEMKGTKNTIVNVVRVETLRRTCNELLQFTGNRADLVLANSSDTPDQPFTYGCPCLVPRFPLTLQPLYERRSWVLDAASDRVYRRILIHGKDTGAWNRMNLQGLTVLGTDPARGWKLVDNRLPLRMLLIQTGLSPHLPEGAR